MSVVQEKYATRCINNEANNATDSNEAKSIDTELGFKVVGKSSRSSSFYERMK